MKIGYWWDVAACSPVDTVRRFRDAYCFRHEGDDGGSAHF
jgi:hypothetical protein